MEALLEESVKQNVEDRFCGKRDSRGSAEFSGGHYQPGHSYLPGIVRTESPGISFFETFKSYIGYIIIYAE